MTEMSYQQLVRRLGPPLTEKHLAGATGVRSDCFKCGCLRLVKMRPDAMTVQFVPCAEHKSEFEGETVL